MPQEGIAKPDRSMQPKRAKSEKEAVFMDVKTLWARADGIFIGIAFAVIVFAIGATSAASEDLLFRAFIAFMLGICTKPATDGVMINMASEAPLKHVRFLFGWAMGSTWGLAMILAFWPLEISRLIIWISAGAFFGTMMAMFAKASPVAPERLALYDTRHNSYDGWKPVWQILVGPFFMLIWIGLFAFLSVAGETMKTLHLGSAILGVYAAVLYPFSYPPLKFLQSVSIPAVIIPVFLAL